MSFRYRRCLLHSLASCMFTVVGFSEQVAWEPSLDSAVERVVSEKKFIVLDISADWHPPCREMAVELYPDHTFIEFSRTQVFMWLDAYKHEEGQ